MPPAIVGAPVFEDEAAEGVEAQEGDEDLTVAEMKEYATGINKDARRLNRLVGEMLDLSRMESGRMSIHLENLDLNAIVEDTVETEQAELTGSRIVRIRK